jgi:hypothetical protein
VTHLSNRVSWMQFLIGLGRILNVNTTVVRRTAQEKQKRSGITGP